MFILNKLHKINLVINFTMSKKLTSNSLHSRNNTPKINFKDCNFSHL